MGTVNRVMQLCQFVIKTLAERDEYEAKRDYALAIGNMAHVYKNMCEYDQALVCFETQKTTSEKLGDRN